MASNSPFGSPSKFPPNSPPSSPTKHAAGVVNLNHRRIKAPKPSATLNPVVPKLTQTQSATAHPTTAGTTPTKIHAVATQPAIVEPSPAKTKQPIEAQSANHRVIKPSAIPKLAALKRTETRSATAEAATTKTKQPVEAHPANLRVTKPSAIPKLAAPKRTETQSATAQPATAEAATTKTKQPVKAQSANLRVTKPSAIPRLRVAAPQRSETQSTVQPTTTVEATTTQTKQPVNGQPANAPATQRPVELQGDANRHYNCRWVEPKVSDETKRPVYTTRNNRDQHHPKSQWLAAKKDREDREASERATQKTTAVGNQGLRMNTLHIVPQATPAPKVNKSGKRKRRAGPSFSPDGPASIAGSKKPAEPKTRSTASLTHVDNVTPLRGRVAIIEGKKYEVVAEASTKVHPCIASIPHGHGAEYPSTLNLMTWNHYQYSPVPGIPPYLALVGIEDKYHLKLRREYSTSAAPYICRLLQSHYYNFHGLPFYLYPGTPDDTDHGAAWFKYRKLEDGSYGFKWPWDDSWWANAEELAQLEAEGPSAVHGDITFMQLMPNYMPAPNSNPSIPMHVPAYDFEEASRPDRDETGQRMAKNCRLSPERDYTDADKQFIDEFIAAAPRNPIASSSKTSPSEGASGTKNGDQAGAAGPWRWPASPMDPHDGAQAAASIEVASSPTTGETSNVQSYGEGSTSASAPFNESALLTQCEASNTSINLSAEDLAVAHDILGILLPQGTGKSSGSLATTSSTSSFGPSTPPDRVLPEFPSAAALKDQGHSAKASSESVNSFP